MFWRSIVFHLQYMVRNIFQAICVKFRAQTLERMSAANVFRAIVGIRSSDLATRKLLFPYACFFFSQWRGEPQQSGGGRMGLNGPHFSDWDNL